jgi:hypothetical protein
MQGPVQPLFSFLNVWFLRVHNPKIPSPLLCQILNSVEWGLGVFFQFGYITKLMKKKTSKSGGLDMFYFTVIIDSSHYVLYGFF